MLLLLPCLWAAGSALGATPTFGGTLWRFASASTFRSTTSLWFAISFAATSFSLTLAQTSELGNSFCTLEFILGVEGGLFKEPLGDHIRI